MPTTASPTSSTSAVDPVPSPDAAPSPKEVADKLFAENLRAQISLTEPAITECYEKPLKAGRSVDGLAAFSFTLVRKDGKVVVESTGVEYASYTDKAVVDCMREAARQLKIDSLPEGADEVVGYRKVGVEKGKLSEHWMTEFSITKGPATPPPASPPSPP